ncbi:V-type sodium ATPase subunit K [archaeon BMS3Abin16]|nr:V-type sodium ATPase subunit K [archaeon BMS3Abin16]
MVVDINIGLKALGAGIAIGFAALGSGIGQGQAASAGVGAIAEKEELFGKAITLAALVETQAIYGFVIAILIMVLLK